MNQDSTFYRICIAIIAVLMLHAPGVSAETKSLKVFLLGGQSNMAGAGQAKELKAPYDTPYSKTPIWSPKAKKWVALTPEAVNGRGRFGPEISFGRAIAEALPKENIRLIKYAVGGTALYNDWAPTKGKQYKGFMQTAKAALADLDASGTKYEIAGMLWLRSARPLVSL